MTQAISWVFCALMSASAATIQAHHSQQSGAPGRPEVLKLAKDVYSIGQLRVDTARREVSVAATANDAHVLEFVANTKGGFKAYESALTVESDAVSFNAALLLIGLDPKHARVPTRHFDPVTPEGDPVEIFVEWTAGGERRRVRVEQLLYDVRTKQPVPDGPWVYTGSTFVKSDETQQYMADLDGVLIGFVHSPAPIIENPRAGAVDSYGSVVFNRRLGLTPGTAVTLTIRALPQKR